MGLGDTQRKNLKGLTFDSSKYWCSDTEENGRRPLWHGADLNKRPTGTPGGTGVGVHIRLSNRTVRKITDKHGRGWYSGVVLQGKKSDDDDGSQAQLAIISVYAPTPSTGENSYWQLLCHTLASCREKDPRRASIKS